MDMFVWTCVVETMQPFGSDNARLVKDYHYLRRESHDKPCWQILEVVGTVLLNLK